MLVNGTPTNVASGTKTLTASATNYISVSQAGVEVLTWPTCTFSGAVYTCKGSTVSGQPIVGVTGESKPLQVKVSVGGRQIFEGFVRDVLEKEGRKP